MKILRLSTWLHKWIALLVGLQVLFWVGGGLVMTVIPIETVRGEHQVREVEPRPLDTAALPSLAEVAARAGMAPVRAELKPTPRGAAWTLTPAEGDPVIVSARNGAPFAPLTEAEARTLAEAAFTGSAPIASAMLLTEAPGETGRTGPLWRVEFADREGARFYLTPDTGEVVSRRSDVWRFYDLMWRLHVMDWNDGEDFNHPLIIVTTALSLVIVLSGFVLLWIRLGRDLAGWRSRRRA